MPSFQILICRLPRGKSDLLAGGIWSSCHRFWCSCRLLSARSLLSFFSFFLGLLELVLYLLGRSKPWVCRKPRPEPEVPQHRARDFENKSPNCKQFEPSELRETSRAQQIHTLPPPQNPKQRETGRHNAGTASAAPGPENAEG